MGSPPNLTPRFLANDDLEIFISMIHLVLSFSEGRAIGEAETRLLDPSFLNRGLLPGWQRKFRWGNADDKSLARGPS